VVLSLFDLTGIFVQPWIEAGCEGWIVDIQHRQGMQKCNGLIKIGADIKRKSFPTLSDYNIVFVAAWPPCDHLAVSGARWFKGKGLRALAKSIELFAEASEICEFLGVPYLIENPVSTISTYWRKPDYTFHPYEYAAHNEADNYRKKTCLWTGNGFVMPDPAGIDAEPDERIWRAPPSPERKNLRSATPLGFARAVFEANRHVLKGG
jgi:hypothetical protein